ncbi:hypothetical protein AB0J86_03855 [Micromonospora sp. NPDC049559]|uniref:hypothetical protein n=1 Tax=Micromonospora sp. NPDC049559 TaxID=3155923 RepID=UPI003419E121
MRWVAETATWYAVLLLAWLAMLSSRAAEELVAGAVCALPTAVVAVAARRAIRRAWRPRPAWATWPLLLVPAVPADTARLLGRVLPGLLRTRAVGGRTRGAAGGRTRGTAGRNRSAGRTRGTATPPGEPAARRDLRRAWGTIVLSATPGSVVLRWPADGPAVLHVLGSGRPSPERTVTR